MPLAFQNFGKGQPNIVKLASRKPGYEPNRLPLAVTVADMEIGMFTYGQIQILGRSALKERAVRAHAAMEAAGLEIEPLKPSGSRPQVSQWLIKAEVALANSTGLYALTTADLGLPDEETRLPFDAPMPPPTHLPREYTTTSSVQFPRLDADSLASHASRPAAGARKTHKLEWDVEPNVFSLGDYDDTNRFRTSTQVQRRRCERVASRSCTSRARPRATCTPRRRVFIGDSHARARRISSRRARPNPSSARRRQNAAARPSNSRDRRRTADAFL